MKPASHLESQTGPDSPTDSNSICARPTALTTASLMRNTCDIFLPKSMMVESCRGRLAITTLTPPTSWPATQTSRSSPEPCLIERGISASTCMALAPSLLTLFRRANSEIAPRTTSATQSYGAYTVMARRGLTGSSTGTSPYFLISPRRVQLFIHSTANAYMTPPTMPPMAAATISPRTKAVVAIAQPTIIPAN